YYAGAIETWQARACLGVSAIFAVTLMVRASPWLIPFNFLATLAFLYIAASLSLRGTLFHLPFGVIVRRCVLGAFNVIIAPAYLSPLLSRVGRGQSGRLWAVIRGVVVAAPLVLLLGLLLASADVVFAQLFDIEFS